MKTLISIVMLLFCTQNFAVAGTDGGGGAVVLSGGKWYLFDFSEAGIEQSPYIDQSSVVPAKILDRVKVALAGLPGAPHELVARKLYEIYLYDEFAYYRFIQLLEHLSWRLTDRPLKEADDHTNTVVDLGSITFGWAAFRTDSVVTIHKHYWNLLDSNNRVGLIFHEIVYAATDRELLRTVGNRAYYYGSFGIDSSATQTEKLEANKKARVIVSELFLPTFVGAGKKKAFRLISRDAWILSAINDGEAKKFEIESDGDMWAVSLRPKILVGSKSYFTSEKIEIDPKTADLNKVASTVCQDMRGTGGLYSKPLGSVNYVISPSVVVAQTPDFNYEHGLKFWDYWLDSNNLSRSYLDELKSLQKLNFNVKIKSVSYVAGSGFDLKKCIDDVNADLRSVVDHPFLGTPLE